MDSLSSQQPGSGIRVVVVDDDPVFLRTLHRVLKMRGFTVQGFGSFAEASSRGDLMDCDAILADVNLGQENGIDTCTAARRDGFAGAILMVSGLRDIGTRVRSFEEAHADDYLIKPLEIEDLVARIRAAVRARRAGHEDRARSGGPPAGQFGAFRLDPGSEGVWAGRHLVRLAPLRYKLLALLVAQQGTPLSLARIAWLVQGGVRTSSATENLLWQLKEELGAGRDLYERTREGVALSPYPPSLAKHWTT
ncbi:MAG: response regulator transcription factor [Myxococcales bacterium]|nr:response regulator transcription factor [Myxococcales bacterium]